MISNSPQSSKQKYMNQDENFESTQRANQKAQIQNLHKIFIIGLIFGSFLLYRILFSHSIQKNCVVDHLHQITFGINRWIKQNAVHQFLGIGQILMDVNVCWVTFYWMIFVKNFRYPSAGALFFYMRAFLFKVNTMPFTSYVIWEYPGLPGITVSYDHTSDYFYSGHTGTAIIMLLEFRKLKFSPLIQIYLGLSALYMIFMLITVRVHYTIDVTGGIIYSIFFYGLVQKNPRIFDMIANAPYNLVDMIKQKVVEKYKSIRQQQQTSLYDISHE